jgi:hypothetical protein
MENKIFGGRLCLGKRRALLQLLPGQEKYASIYQQNYSITYITFIPPEIEYLVSRRLDAIMSFYTGMYYNPGKTRQTNKGHALFRVALIGLRRIS